MIRDSIIDASCTEFNVCQIVDVFLHILYRNNMINIGVDLYPGLSEGQTNSFLSAQAVGPITGSGRGKSNTRYPMLLLIYYWHLR